MVSFAITNGPFSREVLQMDGRRLEAKMVKALRSGPTKDRPLNHGPEWVFAYMTHRIKITMFKLHDNYLIVLAVSQKL
jgi:hypothetical protein